MIRRYLLFQVQNLPNNQTDIYIYVSCLVFHYVLPWRKNFCDSSPRLENNSWLFQFELHFHFLRHLKDINSALIQTALEERRKIKGEIWGRYRWFVNVSIMENCLNLVWSCISSELVPNDSFLVHLEKWCPWILQE